MKVNNWLKFAIAAGCSMAAIVCGNSSQPAKIEVMPSAVASPKLVEPKLLQVASDSADAILGIWLNEKGDRKMEIYKKGAGYYGKIISDASGKVRPGTDILRDLRYANNAWKGRLYLPARNDEAKATLKLKGNQLEIAASKGVFGEKRIWRKHE